MSAPVPVLDLPSAGSGPALGLDFRAATPDTFRPDPVVLQGSSGVFWTFTKWGVVAAAVGYCFYYDKKRRSAPGFKDAHRLKRKAERVAKEKEDKAALAKKKAAAQQMAAAMMGGGQAPPQQQQKPPKAMIVKQAEQYCTQGVALIDGADQDTPEGQKKTMSGINIMLESVRVMAMAEDPKMLSEFCKLAVSQLKEKGHHRCAQLFEENIPRALQM